MITYSTSFIEITLPIAQALIAFASKDTTRPHLGVGIDKGALCATDGHRAVQFPFMALDSIHQGKVWSRDHVETAVKVAKAKKATTISLTWDECLQGYKLPPISQAVPDYGVEATEVVGFNADYFADLTKVCKACGTQQVALTSLRAPLDPLGFTITGPEVTAKVAIMPMRR